MNLYPFTPYASEGETFAQAITRCMNLIGDDDAAIIMDHDIMPGTVRDWYPRIEAHLKNGMQFGTCLTNRLYSGYQIAEDAPQTNDDLEHANYGKKLTEANSGQYDIITDGKLASGHFFVITKAAWNRMGALETKTIIKVDNEIHEKMKAAGIDLWLMRDVYVYHRYRFGDRNDTAHLDKPILPTEAEQEAAMDPAMRKVCYTVITNGYDNLKQPQLITPGWEYLLFTDQPERFEANKGIWKVMAVEPEENPILLQRRLKAICPIKAEKGRLLRTVYIDGTHTILGNLDEFVAATGHQWGTVTTKQHPERNCAYQEAETCEKLGKETPAKIKKTVAFLRKEKFPKDAGLSETNVMIRDYNDPAGSSQLSRAMKQWEKMFRLHSHRDQLTLSYVLSKYPKLKHLRAPADAFNPYFSKQTHINGPSKVVEPKVATPKPPVAAAVPQPQSQPVEYMVPERRLSERFALNIYVTANETQLGLIQPFIENALGSNPEAHVEVVIPLGIQGADLPDLSRVEEQYVGQYLVRQHEWLKTEANGHWGSYRYLIEPELLTKYVFTPDIELMITRPILETFLPLMEASGLSYFNTVRPSNVHMVNEHFSEYAALYGHALTPHIPEVRDANSESLLLRIVSHKGNPLPETTDRPVVGKRMMVTG